jgi:3-hydroxyacyl-CoA dehydrogenase
LRIVGEGIAYRPVDVDMVFLHGYGFARERADRCFTPTDRRTRAGPRIAALAAGRNGWAGTGPADRNHGGQGAAFSTLNV